VDLSVVRPSDDLGVGVGDLPNRCFWLGVHARGLDALADPARADRVAANSTREFFCGGSNWSRPTCPPLSAARDARLQGTGLRALSFARSARRSRVREPAAIPHLTAEARIPRIGGRDRAGSEVHPAEWKQGRS
jgi:hypothetical protein